MGELKLGGWELSSNLPRGYLGHNNQSHHCCFGGLITRKGDPEWEVGAVGRRYPNTPDRPPSGCFQNFALRCCGSSWFVLGTFQKAVR